MLLLKEVNVDNVQNLHEEFIRDQLNDQLTLESFKKLSESFQQFTEEQIETHIRASLIASVTLSPQAQTLTKEQLGPDSFPMDSVRFSGKTVTQCGDIYPAFSNTSPSIQQKLWACFPNDLRHWRHAFFMENSICLDPLKNEISQCTPDEKEALKERITEWLNYWVINALGFNGHVSQTFTGSAFMTESVYQRAQFLNTAILGAIDASAFTVFEDYSDKCAQHLQLNIQNKEISLFIIRLLNMANIFNRKEGTALHNYISDNKILNKVEAINQETFYAQKVATYVPGLLQNVITLLPDDLKKLIDTFSWIGKTLATSPVDITSFRLMDKNKLETLLNSDFSAGRIGLNTGNVYLEGEEPEEGLHKSSSFKMELA